MTNTTPAQLSGEKLDPCPFCGSAARIHEGSGWYGAGCDTVTDGVMCFGYCSGRQFFDAATTAVAWNSRAQARAARQAQPVDAGVRADGVVIDYGTPAALAQAAPADLTDVRIDEQAAFEAWARGSNQGFALKGTRRPDGVWYYFDDEEDIAWAAWQARAAVVAIPAPAGEAERFRKALKDIAFCCATPTAITMRKMAHAALAASFAQSQPAGAGASSVKRWRERQAESIGVQPPMHYADAEIAELRAQIARQGAAPAQAERDEAIAAEMKRLHDALCFWLPQNHAGLPDAMQQRIAADAYLLVGYDDMPDPKSAEELGWIATAPAHAGVAQAEPVTFDFRAHLARQAVWSERTFGPGPRTNGVCDHIRKELLGNPS